MSSKYLELVPNGMDPTAYELWRTNAFAAVLGARGGAAFAGAHLAFDCGMIAVDDRRGSPEGRRMPGRASWLRIA